MELFIFVEYFPFPVQDIKRSFQIAQWFAVAQEQAPIVVEKMVKISNGTLLNLWFYVDEHIPAYN